MDTKSKKINGEISPGMTKTDIE